MFLVWLQFMFNEGKIVIRNGTIVNADRQFKSDVYVDDGKIRYWMGV